MSKHPILYIKRGCPWCRDAMSFFQKHAVEVDLRDVNLSAQNMQRMIEVSGQTKTPTLEFGDFIVPDFSVEELTDALDEEPEVRLALGLPDNYEDD